MARVTPEEYQEKQARRLKGAVEDMKMGVAKVTESPTEKAAAAKDKMQARLNEALNNGKWEAGLKRVSLDDWKKAMTEKGINRVAAGIDGAKPKVIAFARDLLPYIDEQRAKIKAMPDATLEDSISRMVEFTRGMSQFKRS